MCDFEAMLARFRKLGGTAENIVLQEGPFGRGVYPASPEHPVRISVPDHLLVPVEWVALDNDGNIRLSEACTWTAEGKAFYEDLQRDFCWGAGTSSLVRHQQEGMLALPESLKAMLLRVGMDAFSFKEPTSAWCLEKYKAARRFSRDDGNVMLPVLDMVNHSSQAKSWDLSPYGISGIYSGEVLVNYSTLLDPMSMFDVYGFSDQSSFANSVVLSLGHPQFGQMNIGRFFDQRTAMSGTWVPKVKRLQKSIDFSYLPLVNTQSPQLPREFFCQTMLVAGMDVRSAGALFNSLLAANRNAFLQLQQALAGVDGEAAEGLRRMTQHQLDALNS